MKVFNTRTLMLVLMLAGFEFMFLMAVFRVKDPVVWLLGCPVVVLAGLIGWFVKCPHCGRYLLRVGVERIPFKIQWAIFRGICPHCSGRISEEASGGPPSQGLQ